MHKNKRTQFPVAPDMGSFDNGVQLFQSANPPYARGGGNPASQELAAACAQYLWGWNPKDGTPSPAVTLAANGQAANHLVIQALRGTPNEGNHVVVSNHLFGTTKVGWQNTYERHGNTITWVDPCDTSAFIKNSNRETRTWFVEAVSNPAGRVPDFHALREESTRRNILLIVDGTLAAGMNFIGKDYADILTVSLTKQAGGGNNENMGGVVITSNDFRWHEHADKFPEFAAHFTDAQGKLVLPPNPFGTLTTKIGLYEGGSAIVPRVAASIARSMPKLAARVKKQCANARALANMLTQHKGVSSVQLSGYNTDPANDQRAVRYLGNNHFVILLTLSGEAEAVKNFVNSSQFVQAVALGQKETAVSHPAFSTHRQYPKDKLEAMGIHEGTVRLSVGTEPVRDLYQRTDRALRIAHG